MPVERYDVIIVGAGPAGLAAGCEAQDLGLSYLIVDRRGLEAAACECYESLTQQSRNWRNESDS